MTGEKTRCFGSVAMVGALLCAMLLSASTGCVDVKVRPEGSDDAPGASDEPITREEAVRLASLAAREDGRDVSDYRVNDKRVDGAYWVLFDHKRDGGRMGYPHHFAVHVTASGRAQMYKGN